ncbi:hypothetical protein [Streptosporangium sp. 'caverna']|uniref:hypothetical protein n=1 Tax=Streptosporangium sp. 'caverna' TaxID=2202249 RepID=UPI000D7DD1A8|nr:hypothetical protein [Streptosporangium sp. 'caverna']AWS43406.1 hypothetical protein DKM19_20525 [Streptosporangium sp. 'caverna']
MTAEPSFRDLLHQVTHRIPGVPAHAERPAGHQGGTRHGRAWRSSVAHRSQNHGLNHSPARPPRVLVAWQNRIARFFGQEL